MLPFPPPHIQTAPPAAGPLLRSNAELIALVRPDNPPFHSPDFPSPDAIGKLEQVENPELGPLKLARVTVELRVSPDGTVLEGEQTTGHPAFRPNAVRWAKAWRFLPEPQEYRCRIVLQYILTIDKDWWVLPQNAPRQASEHLRVLEAEHQWSEVVTLCHRMLQFKEFPEFRAALASSLFHAGQHIAAEKEAQKTLELTPDDTRAFQVLALVAAGRKDVQAMWKAIDGLSKSWPLLVATMSASEVTACIDLNQFRPMSEEEVALLQPKLLSKPSPPPLSPMARAARVRGPVQVILIIGPEGRPLQATAVLGRDRNLLRTPAEGYGYLHRLSPAPPGRSYSATITVPFSP